jgi:mannose-1-phosphate guanylyltransferase
MFFWTLEAFLRELESAAPAHARAARAIAQALTDGDQTRADALFADLPDISIDYALLEKARDVLVARADFEWDDVGALDALARNLPADASGNVAVGDPILIDAEGCIVYNEPGASAMAVGVVGTRDLVVVVTRDAVLVLPRERAQDVKKVVAALNDRKAAQL